MIIPRKVPCPCGFKGERGGCNKFLLPPLINCVEGTVYEEEADKIIAVYEDAARLEWLLENPGVLAAVQFQKRHKRREFIDKQMEKSRGKEEG